MPHGNQVEPTPKRAGGECRKVLRLRCASLRICGPKGFNYLRAAYSNGAMGFSGRPRRDRIQFASSSLR
jgi:hypothetical protein